MSRSARRGIRRALLLLPSVLAAAQHISSTEVRCAYPYQVPVDGTCTGIYIVVWIRGEGRTESHYLIRITNT